MAPTLVREPFNRRGWVYEEKVDGWRIVAYKDDHRVRLISRNGVDHTSRFHDLAAAISKLSARTLVLDGEVAVYDDQLRSRFEWLREPDPDAVATPPLLMVFDLLYHGGRDVRARPLRDRRARREDIRRRERPGVPRAAARGGWPGGVAAAGRRAREAAISAAWYSNGASPRAFQVGADGRPPRWYLAHGSSNARIAPP
jgi:ATP dependent DNA ligase-like protein